MRKRALLVLLAVVIALLGLARANVVQTDVVPAGSGRAVAEAFDRARSRDREEAGAPRVLGGATPQRGDSAKGAAERRRPSERTPDDPAAPGSTARHDAPRRSHADHDAPAEPERTLGLRDRIGLRDDLAKALRTEFEPLAAECLDQASERAPQLRGMLALSFQITPDSEAGSVVESVEPTDGNEIADAELVECIRETMLSASLPVTDEPQALMITIDVGG